MRTLPGTFAKTAVEQKLDSTTVLKPGAASSPFGHTWSRPYLNMKPTQSTAELGDGEWTKS